MAEAVDIPVICNGGSKEIDKHSDIWKFKEMCGASSIMVARAAEWNCSILRNEPMMPLMDLIDKYLRLAIDYDAHSANAKYCVQNMLRELQESEMGRKFLDAQTLEQICDVFELKSYYREKQAEYLKKGLQQRRDIVPGGEYGPIAKKPRTDSDVIEENIAFIRSNYTKDLDLPKSILHAHTKLKLRTVPSYVTEQRDRLFRATMTLQDKKYSSLFWEKNKKFAEQGAAMVCLLHLGFLTKSELLENGSISPFDE